MQRLFPILCLVVFQSGCSTAYLTDKAPFPRSSVVARFNLEELRSEVAAQHEFEVHRPEPNVFQFKEYPNFKELNDLKARIQDGDQIVEFKNDDWTVGIDHMSATAEWAFCVVRADKIVSTVKIWPTDENR